jgi:hypothetical protein
VQFVTAQVAEAMAHEQRALVKANSAVIDWRVEDGVEARILQCRSFPGGKTLSSAGKRVFFQVLSTLIASPIGFLISFWGALPQS